MSVTSAHQHAPPVTGVRCVVVNSCQKCLLVVVYSMQKVKSRELLLKIPVCLLFATVAASLSVLKNSLATPIKRIIFVGDARMGYNLKVLPQ